LVALVKDLGRPDRFLNMLRVFKPTSPMSVGSWLLAAYVPTAGAAAVCDVTGVLPRVGAGATLGAGLLGPAVASYTGALIADTAVPAWHDAHDELPLLFAASGAVAAGGFGLLGAPRAEAAPARRLAVIGAAAGLVLTRKLRRGLHPAVRRAYEQGRPQALSRVAQALAAAGAIGAIVGRRSSRLTRASGLALLAGSACERFAIFEAGMGSAVDPEATVIPQRERRRESR
jgi:hypothetical protein